ncbi:MAG: M20 family metallopeptidase [Vicinamibacterales bacterium]
MRDFSLLFTAIDDADVIGLAVRLIQQPSHPGIDRQEEAAVGALAGYLTHWGLRPVLSEVVPGRPNLVCTVAGRSPGPHLLLCGHLDTVPLNAKDEGDRFSGAVRNGRLHGRGAVDMKGAIAAMAGALVGLSRTDALESGAVSLAALIDEERESLGAEDLIRSPFRADGAIVGEPTGSRICLGHLGLEWIEVEFIGRAAHGSTPDAGTNAISAAARFVQLVDDEIAPRLKERPHPLLGPARVNVGTIAGGDQPSTVAARCTVTLDRRLVPGESLESVCDELADVLRRVEIGLPGLRTRIRRVPGSTATLDHVALVTDVDAPVARAAMAAQRIVSGEVGVPGAFAAWSDGALLAAYGGIPSIVLGPGDVSLAHSPHESVDIEEVLAAARLYATSALAFCRA